jgi:hypothetical protein
MNLAGYITQVQELVHDSAGIDYTTQELTNFINNARQRVALDFHCVRQLYIDLSTIVAQEVYPITSGIAGVEVVTGGTYVPPAIPTVTFDPPPAGGIQATGIAVMNSTNTAVASVGMTNWGLGYTAIPNVVFSGGAPAATGNCNAQALLQVLDILSISFIFGVQRTMLQWKPFTLFQAVFRANLNNVGQPAAWSNLTESNQFYIYPIPDQNYELEIDAITLPNFLVNPTDADLQIMYPMADCVQFYASHLALLKAQNFEQAEYMHKKYKARQMEVQLTRQSRRISNPYQTFWRRLQRGF